MPFLGSPTQHPSVPVGLSPRSTKWLHPGNVPICGGFSVGVAVPVFRPRRRTLQVPAPSAPPGAGTNDLTQGKPLREPLDLFTPLYGSAGSAGSADSGGSTNQTESVAAVGTVIISRSMSLLRSHLEEIKKATFPASRANEEHGGLGGNAVDSSALIYLFGDAIAAPESDEWSGLAANVTVNRGTVLCSTGTEAEGQEGVVLAQDVHELARSAELIMEKATAEALEKRQAAAAALKAPSKQTAAEGKSPEGPPTTEQPMWFLGDPLTDPIRVVALQVTSNMPGLTWFGAVIVKQKLLTKSTDYALGFTFLLLVIAFLANVLGFGYVCCTC